MISDKKITDFKEITSEDPIKQIWKLLRFFLDVPSVSDVIRQIHNTPKGGKYDQDIKKQARQIGYCIRQAEEYFHASSQVDLPTRPLLLYYGVTSLAWALILLRKDGRYSFDKLRTDKELKRHKHHGLDTIGDVCSKGDLEDFFNSLRCKCHTKKKIPCGTFILFYESLVPCAYHIEAMGFLRPDLVTKEFVLNCAELPPLDRFVTEHLNALKLVRSLSDMYSDLLMLDIQPDLYEGGVQIEEDLHCKGEKILAKKVTFIFEMKDLTPDGMACIRRLFESCASRNPNSEIHDNPNSPIIRLKLTKETSPSESEETDMGCYPSIVDDINDRKFYILRPEDYIPEPAAHFILLFSLGMLSRYYPDIWIKTIDENVQIAEFTDSLLNVIYRKFPNLILDQMRRVKHYVHI